MSTMGAAPGLLDLPEEVICEILRLVDATTLYLLSRTCTRLSDIIRNNVTLWRYIDARRAPNNQEKINYCLERCYDDGNTWTHSLLLQGDCEKEILMPPWFLPKISTLMNLAVLACEKQMINGRKYSAMTFPPQLQELSLRGTVVTSSLKFFKGSGEHFKNLRVLILDECNWLTSADFMPIAKFASLEILSVYKCRSIENSIAYLSMACQGFKSLKIFDARLSPLGSTLIRAIYRLQSLLAIYLQNRDVSYKLDYYRRKLEIIEGSTVSDSPDVADEFNEEDKEPSLSRNCEDNEVLDDNGLIDYLAVPSNSKDSQFPKSVLYLDPYNVCTCGFEEAKAEKNKCGSDDDNDDDDNWKKYESKRKLLMSKIGEIARLIELSQRADFSRRLPDTYHPPDHTDTLRSFLQSGAATSMGDVHICLNISLGPQNEQRRIIFAHGSSREDSDEPPTKRPRNDEPEPGCSGRNTESDSDDSVPPRRPPTPHPDVALNSPENIVYKVAFEDAPIVQIENIEDTNKNMKVSLRRLSLRGYKKITDTTLRYIGNLDLDLLDLTYTGVTFQGIQEYLQTHPLCRIVHERFCTCLPNMHF